MPKNIRPPPLQSKDYFQSQPQHQVDTPLPPQKKERNNPSPLFLFPLLIILMTRPLIERHRGRVVRAQKVAASREFEARSASLCGDWKTLSVNPAVNGYLFRISVKGRPLAQQLSCLTDSERPWVRVPVGPRFFPPL